MGFLPDFFSKYKRKQGIAALSFTTEHINLAIVDYQRPQGAVLKFCQSIACTAHNYVDILSNLRTAHQLTDYDCLLVLNQKDYRLITTEQPAVDDTEIKQALRWKINDLLEYPIDEAVLDYYVLPASKRSNSTPLMEVVASHRPVIAKQLELCQQAGFMPIIIDIQETATRNLASLSIDNQQGLAVLHLYEQSGRILVQKENTIYLSRKIALGYQQLHQSMFETSGSLPDPVLDNLSLEVQRSLDYIESHYDIPPINSLAVIPIPENTQNIVNFFNNSFGITSHIMDLTAITNTETMLDDSTQNHCADVIGAAFRNALEDR